MIPAYWRLAGPSRRNAAGRVLRLRNVAGGHAAGLYRLLRIGPFGIYLVRYRQGRVDEAEQTEVIP